jgi:hypothetical protein
VKNPVYKVCFFTFNLYRYGGVDMSNAVVRLSLDMRRPVCSVDAACVMAGPNEKATFWFQKPIPARNRPTFKTLLAIKQVIISRT